MRWGGGGTGGSSGRHEIKGVRKLKGKRRGEQSKDENKHKGLITVRKRESMVRESKRVGSEESRRMKNESKSKRMKRESKSGG